MKTITFDETKWALVPIEPTSKQLADSAFNLCNEHGLEFVQKQEKFARDVYSEMVANAPEHQHSGPPPVSQSIEAYRYWKADGSRGFTGRHSLALRKNAKDVGSIAPLYLRADLAAENEA